MKRLLFTLLMSTGLCGALVAQQAAPAVPAAAKEHRKATGVTKSGKPDMRLKANRDAAKAQALQPVPPVPAPQPRPVVAKPQATPVPAPVPRPAVVQSTQPAVAAADPVIGTDAKGRTIYRGKRGGRYYVNKNGHKEYIK
ncbi:hypothetical protein [Niabella drilacis]|uniref:PBCV-specific basic adaptor domain-containing protein n=1 Tax=Niabella drilacis (strain DSM 25811 / CCM 8410 / CCUG 62505 / LMG 26954 / E90) TaxID=1285928 RepID=A0A1G6JNY4_NIADE|nr:hypothetical protein [Niabella drilacis]SDC20388.1 PBCV-specific basic adaptor domain-containing protein [Niabella drilacis]